MQEDFNRGSARSGRAAGLARAQSEPGYYDPAKHLQSVLTGELAPQHQAMIDASSIAPEVATARGYTTVEDAGTLARLGFSGSQAARVPALLVPVYGTSGDEPRSYQLRPDTPRQDSDGKPIKYETPAGGRLCLDVPREARKNLCDPSVPLYITEGARKADSAVSRGLCCVALQGVAAWRGTNEQGGKLALPDWNEIALNGREVLICFDSDVTSKATVRRALAALVRFMDFKGARVRVVYLPEGPGGAKVGLDDFFSSGGTVEELAQHAGEMRPAPRLSTYPTTDTGNAERFAAQHGERVRYCAAWGKWLLWDGARWQPDARGQVAQRAKATVRGIGAEAAKTEDDEQRRELLKWAARSEAKARRVDLLALAQSEEGLPVAPEELDADPWRLNVANGTLDLRTGELHPHDPDELCTKLAPVAYDPEAQCPRWRKFLGTITGERPELARYIQKAVGYALTGDTREQCFFVLHGAGSNGKSTLVETVAAMLGDYALQTDSETLLAKPAGGVSNDVARLRGARFVVATETDEGRRLAESKIKQLTGGDTISARFLHQEFFDFKPVCKIFLATNHEPEIRGTDEAIWRRVRKVPFGVRFWDENDAQGGAPEHRKDKALPARLLAELSGILAWAVEGCLLWQREGLQVPDEVRAATATYRAGQDRLAAFLDECCCLGPSLKVEARALFNAYESWCKRNGEPPVTSTAFGKRLTEAGFEAKKSGTVVRLGLGLLAD